jgi:signal peptidase I
MENQKPADSKKAERIQTVLRFIMKLAVFSLTLWVVFTFVFGLRQISGEAMYPKLRDGDLILYYRLERDYEIDDVVSFKMDRYHYVARIVAQGGDVVEVNNDGELLVNGHVKQEEIFYSTFPLDGDVTYPYTVPEGSYFVLCDFRTSSDDSRSYGAVPKEDLDGKIITILRRRGI